MQASLCSRCSDICHVFTSSLCLITPSCQSAPFGCTRQKSAPTREYLAIPWRKERFYRGTLPVNLSPKKLHRPYIHASLRTYFADASHGSLITVRKLAELSASSYSTAYARTKRFVARGLLAPCSYARHSYNAGPELA